MTKHPHPPPPFEDEFIALLRESFEDRMVFHKVIGLKLVEISAHHALARLAMRPELIGHYTHHRLHGGVIGAALDAVAGMAALAAIGARHMDEPPLKRMERLAKLGTIDLRVDYLRPGIGEHFTARAEVLRLGSRVASTRMEFHGPDAKLLATGAGAYMVA